MNDRKFQSFKILFLLFVIYSSSMLWSYDSRTIYPQNDNISQDLNLDAVASIFGLSSNLEDFEYRLNDPDSQISNLDINEDGYVDYLRVVERAEDDKRLIIIQAVLDRDIYQDVATIVVQRDRYQQTTVEIIGDSYIYGSDFIVEPIYSYTPIIYSYFWSSGYYRTYHSRYRWGYYPTRYRRWRPLPTPYYHKHIHHHIDRRNHYRYRYKRDRYHSHTKAYMKLQEPSKKRGNGHHKSELYKRDNSRVTKREINKSHKSTTNRSSMHSSTRRYQSTKQYKPRVTTHKSTVRYYDSRKHETTKHHNSSRSNRRSRSQNGHYREGTKAKAYLQTK